MNKLAATSLILIFGCWQTNAQAVVLQGIRSPLQITSMQKVLIGERLPGRIQLVADFVIDEPVDDPIDDDPIDDPVDDPIGIRVNDGYCRSDPPKWKYIGAEGLFYYEFCNHLPIDDNLKMDVHKKPGSGGGIGAITSKHIVACSTYYPGTDFLLPDVVADFCHD